MEIAVDAIAFRRFEQPPNAEVFAVVSFEGASDATNAVAAESKPTLGFTFAIRQRLVLRAPPSDKVTHLPHIVVQLRCAASGAVLVEIPVSISKQWTVASPPARGEVFVSYFCCVGDDARPRPLRPSSAIMMRRGSMSRLPGATSVPGSRPATASSSSPAKPMRVGTAASSLAPVDGRRVTIVVKRVEGLILETKQPTPLCIAVCFARRIRRSAAVMSAPTGMAHAAEFERHGVSFFVPLSNLTPYAAVSVAVLATDGTSAPVGTIRLPLTASDGMQPIGGHPDSLIRYAVTIVAGREAADAEDDVRPVLHADEMTAATWCRPAAPTAAAVATVTDLIPLQLMSRSGAMPATERRGPSSSQHGSVPTEGMPPIVVGGMDLSKVLADAVANSVAAAAAGVLRSLATLEKRVASLECLNESNQNAFSALRRAMPRFDDYDDEDRGYISVAQLRNAVVKFDPSLPVTQIDGNIAKVVEPRAMKDDLISRADFNAVFLKLLSV